MRNINLKSSEAAIASSQQTSAGASFLTLGGVALIILATVSMGGVWFFKKQTSQKLSNVQSSITSAKKKLDSKDFVELYDFQGRLLDLKEIILSKNSYSETLEKIATYTLPETKVIKIIEELKTNGASITLTVMVADYSLLSKQIKSYEMINGVGEVALSKSKQEAEGVRADVVFNLKTEKDKIVENKN